MELSAGVDSLRGPLDLRLGPLHYRFSPADSWGETMVYRLAENLTTSPAPSIPDRFIRIGHRLDTGNGPRSTSPLGTFCHGGSAGETYWSRGAEATQPTFRYQLPWALLLSDIARLGGAVIHAGLAIHDDRAALFLAPPGGGKSTTLASAPPDWEVLSDDAALIWPDGPTWLVSPLPSWTAMTLSGGRPATGGSFDTTSRHEVRCLVVLDKGQCVKLEPLPPLDAATPLYRALSEYPATVIVGLPLKERWFCTACSIARALPCRRLQLPRGGDVWPLLRDFSKGSP